MPRTYFLYSTNSDLTVAGATYNKYFLPNLINGPAATAQSITIAGSSNLTASAFTYQFHPGDHAQTGSYTASLQISTANTNAFLSTRWHRINSAGTVQTSTTSSAEQQLSSATAYAFNWGGVNLGTFANTDRIRVDYMFRNSNSKNQNAAFQYNQTGSFIKISAYNRRVSFS